MPCFGNGGTNARNHRLTSDAVRLPVRAIPKRGTVTLTWPQNLAHALHARVTRSAADAVVISTAGVETEVVLREWPMPTVRWRQRGIRWRFACPRCEASRDALHWLPEVGWCCRGSGCGNLAYACRHRQRYCPAIARRARLQRKLARVSSRSLKARWLREQIKREERAMIEHLEYVNNALDKRSERRARHGRRANPERT